VESKFHRTYHCATLSERLGQKVVIENKPGVSGMVGAQYVAKANPDGYTLLAGNTTTNATNYYLTKNSGYHPLKDFVPLSLWDRGPTVLVVPANSRFQTVNDVIKELKNKSCHTQLWKQAGLEVLIIYLLKFLCT
jgi:tripartite-type tricarboxylate transporter receptor subunit TctC